jgi:hypothetical protein
VTHRFPLRYLWPSGNRLYLWHRQGLLYAEVEHPNHISVATIWRRGAPLFRLRPLAAAACFPLWQAAPLEDATDGLEPVPDEATPGRLDQLAAATLAALDSQAPNYCSQVACLLALDGVDQRTVLTHLPLDWPFVCLRFRFSHSDVAHSAPIQRLALTEALRRTALGSSPVIPEERVSPDLLLQPVLHWVRGVAHVLASVCHKGREACELDPPDLLNGLCSPAQWEGHLLEVILADWRTFSAKCLAAYADHVRVPRPSRAVHRDADRGADFRSHAGLEGLSRASFAPPQHLKRVNFLLRQVDVYLPIRVAMIGLPELERGRDVSTSSFSYRSDATSCQHLRRFNATVRLDLQARRARAPAEVHAALRLGAMPTTLLPNVLAYAPSEGNKQVTVSYVLGAPGCAHSSEERFKQLAAALHDNLPRWPSNVANIAQVAGACPVERLDLTPLRSLVVFDRTPELWLPGLAERTGYDCTPLWRHADVGPVASDFLGGRAYWPVPPCRGLRVARVAGGWSMSALAAAMGAPAPVPPVLLDYDFGSLFPPASRATGIVAGCAWPGHLLAHRAVQRDRLRDVMQELGIVVQRPGDGSTVVPSDAPQEGASLSGPVSSAGPASNKRPHVSFTTKPAQVILVEPPGSASNSDQEDSPRDVAPAAGPSSPASIPYSPATSSSFSL